MVNNGGSGNNVMFCRIKLQQEWEFCCLMLICCDSCKVSSCDTDDEKT